MVMSKSDPDCARDVLERMIVATEAMIAGRGALKHRLLSAFEAISPLLEGDFPTEARPAWREFSRKMTVHEAHESLGSAEMTMHAMTGPAAASAARAFAELHAAVMITLAETPTGHSHDS